MPMKPINGRAPPASLIPVASEVRLLERHCGHHQHRHPHAHGFLELFGDPNLTVHDALTVVAAHVWEEPQDR